MTTVVVTGGTGFVGAATGARLLELGVERVVLADAKIESSYLGALADDPRVEVAQLDITDVGLVAEFFSGIRPHAVVHLAAVMGDERTDATAVRTRTDVNIIGSINVLEAARAAGTKRVVAASTIVLLGPDDAYPPESLPLNETAPVQIGTRSRLYSAGKLYLENVAEWYTENTELDVRVIRPSTVYGPGRLNGMKVVSDFITAALNGETDGPQVPDVAMNLIHVDDMAAFFAELALVPAERLGEQVVFNSGGDACTLSEIVEILEELAPGVSLAHRLIPVTGRERDLGWPLSISGAAIERAVGHPRKYTPIKVGVAAFAEGVGSR
jgi:UDP-glucose 4-epimerase